eukprot:EG_transcript_11419
MSPFRTGSSSETARLLQLCQQWTAHRGGLTPRPSAPRRPAASFLATQQPNNNRPPTRAGMKASPLSIIPYARARLSGADSDEDSVSSEEVPVKPLASNGVPAPAVVPLPSPLLQLDPCQEAQLVDSLASPYLDVLFTSFMVAPSPFLAGDCDCDYDAP